MIDCLVSLQTMALTKTFGNGSPLFLKGYKQSVIVDGGKSFLFVDVDSSVPQGTVPGPLLFLLHINDLPSVVYSKVRLFC